MTRIIVWPNGKLSEATGLDRCDYGDCKMIPTVVVSVSSQRINGAWITTERRPMCRFHGDEFFDLCKESDFCPIMFDMDGFRRRTAARIAEIISGE